MDIFSFADYRSILKGLIEKHREVRGFQSRLAEAAGCQKSYLSQVLAGTSPLSLEQAANIAQFCGLDDLETLYFCDLVARERAGNQALRKIIDRRLENLQKKRFEFSSRQSSAITQLQADQALYFSNWLYPVCQVMCSIFPNETALNISKRINVNVERVRQVLNDLKRLGLIEEAGESGFKVTEKNISLDADSPATVGFHTALRHLALAKVQVRESQDGIVYSVIHALSRKDALSIKTILLEAVKQSRELAFSSNEEEVYLFNLDFHQL